LIVLVTHTDSVEGVGTIEGLAAELYRRPEPQASGTESSGLSCQAEIPLLRSQVDDIGNIVFRAVPEGEYVLIVHVPESDLIIEELTIEQT
jgi:hypothetical protein